MAGIAATSGLSLRNGFVTTGIRRVRRMPVV